MMRASLEVSFMTQSAAELPQIEPEVHVLSESSPGCEEILTPKALAFIAGLTRRFAPRLEQILEQRRATQTRIDAGERPDFLDATREIREDHWTVAPLPADLLDRRGENTGPPPAEKGIKGRSEEHTPELQSPLQLVCRLLLLKKKKNKYIVYT